MTTVLELQGWDTTSTLSQLGGSITESVAIGVGGGRLAGNRLSAPNNNDYWRKQSIWSAVSTVAVGFAFFYSGLPTSNSVIFALLGGPTIQLYITPSGFLTLVAGSTTATAIELQRGPWYYVEFKLVISTTVGSYDIRVNGQSVASASSQNTGSGTVTGYDIGACYGGGGTTLSGAGWDDFYVADDFLGDIRVSALAPSGNGNSSQLVGSDGNSTDNYLLVDEIPPNDVTDYVQSSNVGDKDTYAFANLPVAASAIHAVKVKLRAAKDDAGARSIAPVVRHSGTDYDGTTQALGTSYLYYDQLYNTNPGTAAAWGTSDVDNAEFGVKVAA